MLPHDQIAKLAPEARTQLFDMLTGDLFPTQAAACAALDIALRTSQLWRSNNTVPVMALLALQSIASAPNQPSAIVQDARQIAGHLEKVGRELAQLADLMASVAKRLPDPS
jgi:predicted lipoprotein